MSETPLPRVIVWFSAGAASAVAAKLAVQEFGDRCILAYCDTGSEHSDNVRFIADVSKWVGKPVEILKNEKYEDIWDVFKQTGYLVGVAGARCTTALKKDMRKGFTRPDDIQVFGFTLEEKDRASRFKVNNPEVETDWILIRRELTKQDCLALIHRAGIELPTMYKLGYKNNNCIGCVKGQMGYWNKIRRDFPDVFERMSKVERDMDVAINKTYIDGERIRVFLDELDPEAGRYEEEPDISCSLFCSWAFSEMEDEQTKLEE